MSATWTDGAAAGALGKRVGLVSLWGHFIVGSLSILRLACPKLAKSCFLFIVKAMSKRPPFASSAGRPNASDQALERALMALRMERPDEAERITADILKADRGNARAAHVHGQALLMQNRAADAIGPLERAARRRRPAVETLLAHGARRGWTQRRGAGPIAPDAICAGVSRIWRPARQDRALRWANEVLEGGLAFAPDSVELRMELGFLHLKRNDRSKARAMLMQALAAAPERRAHKVDFSARRQIVVPGELAVLDLEIADQRKQKAVRHRVDERRTTLDCIAYRGVDRVECLRWHCLESIGRAERRRHGRWQQALEFRRAAERQCHRIAFTGRHVPLHAAAERHH
jgi:tetratricopeptide (TPR) repeat protein